MFIHGRSCHSVYIGFLFSGPLSIELYLNTHTPPSLHNERPSEFLWKQIKNVFSIAWPRRDGSSTHESFRSRIEASKMNRRLCSIRSKLNAWPFVESVENELACVISVDWTRIDPMKYWLSGRWLNEQKLRAEINLWSSIRVDHSALSTLRSFTQESFRTEYQDSCCMCLATESMGGQWP